MAHANRLRVAILADTSAAAGLAVLAADEAQWAQGWLGALEAAGLLRPLDQAPFEAARTRLGEAELRRQVLAGGYRLVDASAAALGGAPAVTLVSSGATMPEVVEAAHQLCEEGVAASVVDVTSLDRLYRAWRGALRTGVNSVSRTRADDHLALLFGGESRHAPMVTVHDASPHAMAWLGSIFGAPVTALGVDTFGQSASITDTYRLHGLDTDTIVNAALVALE